MSYEVPKLGAETNYHVHYSFDKISWYRNDTCVICFSPKPNIKSIYIIGSLRNSRIVEIANEIQKLGIEAFADWKSPGPDADDYLRDYAKERGLDYKQTLQTYAAKHIFEFDKHHLDRCDAAVMVMPCGRSGFLEAGYTVGNKKPCFALFDETPERIDVMLQFFTEVFFNREEFYAVLNKQKS
jgi:nucleoside 2-deoxyribosyltransferase